MYCIPGDKDTVQDSVANILRALQDVQYGLKLPYPCYIVSDLCWTKRNSGKCVLNIMNWMFDHKQLRRHPWLCMCVGKNNSSRRHKPPGYTLVELVFLISTFPTDREARIRYTTWSQESVFDGLLDPEPKLCSGYELGRPKPAENL